MSIDLFQEKIRKAKNPSVLYLEAFSDLTPPTYIKNDISAIAGFEAYCEQLLEALSKVIPAVRFGFASFAVLGEEGLSALHRLMQDAFARGYYVLLDAPEQLSAMTAARVAEALRDEAMYPCHGFVVNGYLGSDILKPFAAMCKEGKTLFPVVRTANKSAAELQDLLTGSRLVHTAAADVVNRLGEPFTTKCGYSQVGALGAASAADSLRALRGKYKRLFLLLDGYDYPNANAKNCSYAFDNLGHGAAACAGVSVLGAWQEETGDPIMLAVQAAERMKKNLTRYVTVL